MKRPAARKDRLVLAPVPPVRFPSRFRGLVVLAGILGLLSGAATVSGLPVASKAASPAAQPPAGADAARSIGAFRLIASDESGVTLEYVPANPAFSDMETPFGHFQSVSIDGHGTLIELGRPALPSAGVGLAVPEGAEPRLTWEILETREYPGVRPMPSPEGTTDDASRVQKKDGAALDEAIYRGAAPWPDATISFHEMGHLRNHRVGQVAVVPMQFDPAKGGVSMITRARIRVDFAPSTRRAADASAMRYVPVGEERGWEDTYRNTFLNYEAARAFRVRALPELGSELVPNRTRGSRAGVQGPVSAGVSGGIAGDELPGMSDTGFLAGAAAITGPEFRIYVGTTGLYYASYADLATTGWAANVPLNQIRFYEKAYNAASPGQPLVRDIPITIVESGTPDSVFNGDDYFYFYGLDFNDRFKPPFHEGRYTHLHVYWLAQGDTPTARIASTPGWFEAASFTTPASYVHHTHWEQNLKYNYIRPSSGAIDVSGLPETDTHYWIDPFTGLDSLDFSTPGRDSTRPFRIQALWQGLYSTLHYVSIWVTRGTTPPTSDTLLIYRHPFESEAAYLYDSGYSLPGPRLADGNNRLKLGGTGNGGSPDNPGSGAYFNWFNVDYYRRYVASAGFLRFTSGEATGDVEFAIRGLADTTAIVFDVTDSLAPARIEGAHFRQLSGPPNKEYEIRFRANITGQRTYVLYLESAVPPVTRAVPIGKLPPDLGTKNVQKDDFADVTDPGHADADLIVLAHPRFQAALEPWKAKREAPPYNHRVWIVSPQDIWDQFSGGHKSVPAIRTWLRWVYRNRTNPPDYLLLFGDANEDYANDVGTSDEDWVPTMMLYGPVVDALSRLNLVASDNYYVGALSPTGPDYDVYPDMHVGRLSVGSTTEAEAVIAKLTAYDNYSPNDAWRNRGLLVSDDRYSTGIQANAGYLFNAIEQDFVAGADSLNRVYSQMSCYTGFEVQQFRLEDVLRNAPCDLGRTYTPGNAPDLGVNMECTRRYATPLWLDMSSRGHLFNIYSGHGNRFVMTTEFLVRYRAEFGSPEDHTVEQLTNYGKPFIFVGAGCHLNQFPLYLEKQTKASIAEAMVLLPNRGAIASMASTAYEYLQTNKPVEVYLGRVLFSDHPRDPDTGRPRRILGEGFDQAMVRMATEVGQFYGEWYRNCLKTYCLLGDPSMQIDMAPPRLSVSVDGAPADSGVVVTPAPGATFVRITARLSDDVDYRTGDDFSIEDNGVAVPPDQYTITPVNDQADGACRGADIEYVAGIKQANYPITLRAKDWIGREMSFTVNVLALPMNVRFMSSGSELHPWDRVMPDQPIEIQITSPVDLTAEQIRVTLNGEAGHFDVTGSGKNWTATSTGTLPEGQIEIEILVMDHSIAKLTLQVGQTEEVFFFPNPWEGNGPGRFLYYVPGGAGRPVPSSARVTVFTVSGRKVITLDGTVDPGENQIQWDMRDAAGDGLANGVYLFKLVLDTGSGKKRTTIDRIVVHR